MKNRVLSSVLAIALVFSMVSVFSLGSFSESPRGVTVALGTTYAVAGTTAKVDVYVFAEWLPETHDHIRDWQFVFSGPKIAGESDFYTSDDHPFSFVNEEKNSAGCTSSAGQNIGTAAQVTAMGGMKIASITFEVPEDAKETISVSVEVEVLRFESKEDTAHEYSVADSVETVAGKIYIVDSLSGSADAHNGTNEDYEIPLFNANGQKVTKLENKAITGTYQNLIIPSSVLEATYNSLNSATITNLILKNSEYTELPEGIKAALRKGGLTAYYQKRANGTDTTKNLLETFVKEEEPENVTLKNILSACTKCKVEGNRVSFVGGIAAKDLLYSNVTLEVRFVEKNRTFTSTVTTLYTTLRDVASTDKTTATAQHLLEADQCLITGLTITGVPEGTHTVEVTVYGSAMDAGGNYITVCSDTVTINNITVKTAA